MSARLRSLYVCYLGLDDPLVRTQVVAYLAGLAARGHHIHLLTFETGRLTRARRSRLRRELASAGISWHGLRYHKRPSLPATAFDVLCGALLAARLLRRHRLDVLHARSHVPAAMALLARPRALVFDIRGLMAEEYEDAGRWQRGSLPWRLTKRVERAAIARAAAIVVLTVRARSHLFGSAGDPRVHVIPCCADVERIAALAGDRAAIRRRLGVCEQTFVLVYVGKLGGWYMDRETVAFAVAARRRHAPFHFLVLSQSPHAEFAAELRRNGVEHTITSVRPEDVGAYLAAADAAIALIRPSPSKLSSSPTKIGEYLAAGLPIVCRAGVGDVDELLAAYGVGVAMDDDDAARGAERLALLVGDRGHAERCVRAARERLSLQAVGVPAYDEIYARLARCAYWS